MTGKKQKRQVSKETFVKRQRTFERDHQSAFVSIAAPVMEILQSPFVVLHRVWRNIALAVACQLLGRCNIGKPICC